MKLEFAGIRDQFIRPQSVFFLYGNYKDTFDLFCDFLFEKIQKNFGNHPIKMHHISVADSLKITSEQCNLFASQIDCFCLRNVEDNHLEKLQAILQRENTIFILECGDYAKSKKITDHCQKDKNIYAIASFRNDITFRSICRMFFPTASAEVHRMLAATMENRDEALSSFFTKVSLLLKDLKNPENCTDALPSILKQTFLQELDTISLIRYLANAAIRKKFHHRHRLNLQLNLQKQDVFTILLKAEIRQKLSGNVRKSHIYQALI
ncbi:MAG: hypothetical protein LBJ19_01260 [Holosporaceae bacterium]|jgi:hypothetical protein|nr:hypothetical protein [Holosporaceae bacterium]